MRYQTFWSALVLVAVVSSTSASADDPVKLAGSGPITTLKVGDISYTLPFGLPSGKEILQALPEKARPKNARIQCVLLVYRLGDPRFYPGVGPAHLAQAHFKCTVSAGGKSEVVYIDRDHLIAEK